MYLFDDVPILRARFVLWGVAPAGVAVSGAVYTFVTTRGVTTLIGAAVVAVLGVLWCVHVHGLQRQRARKVMVRTRGLACLHCGYSLLGGGEAGNCPECGRSYYAEHVQACWARAAEFP